MYVKQKRKYFYSRILSKSKTILPASLLKLLQQLIISYVALFRNESLYVSVNVFRVIIHESHDRNNEKEATEKFDRVPRNHNFCCFVGTP